MILWILFFVCTGMIVFSGIKLSRYGDIIAEKTGLGRTLIGVILMASVTSLPELITGVSSVVYVGVPDIAVGDVLGSCVFNIFIFFLLDAMYKSQPISTKAHQGHILTAGYGIILISLTALSIYLGSNLSSVGWIGINTLIVVVIYFVAMRHIYLHEKIRIAEYIQESAVEQKYKTISKANAYTNYLLHALVIIIAASFLPKIGEGIAAMTGLGQTFVGNIFIAISTSLPEIVISVSAVKMGLIDLAIGNLLGSNVFNIFILAIDDILFIKGPILHFSSSSHIISAMSAIMMTAFAIIGITYRAQKKKFIVSWDSIGIALLYILNIMFLYMVK